jgi:hypothetical protein
MPGVDTPVRSLRAGVFMSSGHAIVSTIVRVSFAAIALPA